MAKGTRFKPCTKIDGRWVSYDTLHQFSKHDNREVFCKCGESLGIGPDRQAGRKLASPEKNLHHRGYFFLRKAAKRAKHDQPTISTYIDSYQGLTTDRQPYFQIFPKVYKDAESGRVKLSTTTTVMDPLDAPALTAQMVKKQIEALGVTKIFRQKPNPWKYSYHSSPKMYPPLL